MNIICSKTKSNSSNSTKIPTGQQVNRVGKYLYKNLDGAFKIEYSPNTCDVYVTLLYEVPYLQKIPGRGREYNKVHEMTLDLNITTYQNKVRVNILETDENERTLGHNVYSPEVLENLQSARDIIYKNVVKHVSKAYAEYDFIF